MRAGTALLCLALATAPAAAAAPESTTADAKARWADLSEALFGDGVRIEDTDRLVTVDAPEMAHEAALVPVALSVAPDAKLKEINLVIDQNPGPLAAKVKFGPAGDSRLLKLRVRVDSFTNMRVVGVGEDGTLVQNAIFVKAAGGCSAPFGVTVEEASQGMGDIKLKFGSASPVPGAAQATLMIRHPNFNGLQIDHDTQGYTPARFIKSIAVTRGPESVFSMTSDISLSSDPVIQFLYQPEGGEPFSVTVVDTEGATWTKRFDAPQSTN